MTQLCFKSEKFQVNPLVFGKLQDVGNFKGTSTCTVPPQISKNRLIIDKNDGAKYTLDRKSGDGMSHIYYLGHVWQQFQFTVSSNFLNEQLLAKNVVHGSQTL